MNGNDNAPHTGAASKAAEVGSAKADRTNARLEDGTGTPVAVDAEDEKRIITAVLEDEDRPRVQNPEMPYDVAHAEGRRPPASKG